MAFTARTPNLFVVGSGPVAATLAGALRRAGAPVLGLWGRRPDATRWAGSLAGVAAFSAAPPDLILEADVLVLAVSDGAIAEVATKLLGTGLVTKNHVFLHCSGAFPAREAFGDVAGKVGGVGTLHPLRSIVDPRQAIATLKGTLFGIEGDAVGRETARRLADLLGGKALDLEGQAMAAYHCAASIASNYLVTLLDAAVEVMAGAGISREEALPALLPLVQGTVENLGRVGLPKALTGAIARGDAATVERHLAALEEKAPSVVELYRAAGRRALAVAKAKGDAPPGALERVAAALEARR